MSRALAMVRAVAKNPGLTPRQIGDALGLHWASAVNVVCSQLLQLERAGKLRREGQPKAYRYFPTDISLVDKRFGKRTATADAPKRRRRPVLKVPAKRVVPKPASRIGLVPAKPVPPPMRSAHPAGPRETVEEFLARGGRVQRLPMGAVAVPLGRGAAQQIPMTGDKTMQFHATALSGPEFLDAIADANAAAALDINAQAFRERAIEWQRDKKLIDDQAKALQALRDRIDNASEALKAP